MAGSLSAQPISKPDVPEPPTPRPSQRVADVRTPEVSDAIQQFQKGDFDGARKALEAACKKDNDLPPPDVLMAELFARARQPQAVRLSLERAVINSAEDPEAYVVMGDLAMQESRVSEAAALYNESVRLLKTFDKSPKRKVVLEPRAISGQASVAEARGDWATAEKHLETVLKVSPKDAQAMVRLARAQFQEKKAVAAYDMLKEAHKTDADNVLTPEATLATFYEQYGDPKNAKKWMGYAIKAAPQDLRTVLVAAQWALQTGQIEEALTHTTNALKLKPSSVEAQLLRGVVALFQKDFQSAETYFESAHLQTPTSFAAQNNLALALCEQSDETKKRRALEYATSLARQFPRAPEAAATYGWVLFKAGQAGPAEQALRQAASAGNISAETAYYLAEVLAARNMKEDAKRLLQAALKNPRPFYKRQEAESLLEKVK